MRDRASLRPSDSVQPSRSVFQLFTPSLARSESKPAWRSAILLATGLILGGITTASAAGNTPEVSTEPAFSPSNSLLLASVGVSTIQGVAAAATTRLSPLTQPNSQLISQQADVVEITLASFAVTKAAYDQIIPRFVNDWKKKTGQSVLIRTSFAGSGTQTRAILDGLQADITHLALAGDTNRLVKGKLIKAGWEKEVPNNGIVARSVVAIETRDGNPKKINGWQDLTRPGITWITANPKTSGVARWNFLALWGSVSEAGGTEAQARDFVGRAYKNVPILGKDARETSDIFYKKKKGDAVLNYENEVLLAAQQGQTNPSYILPQTNISIDTPVAVVDAVVNKRKTRKVAEAFVQFLFTPIAQRDFARVGFRPVNPTVAKEFEKKYPRINKLYTVNDLGGWEAIDKKFFANGAIFDQIYKR